MMNFATLQGSTIPEGVVTQIAKDGVVLWAVGSSDTIILEVEKITSDTYAAETLYEGEQFILLDIYPKTSGTVSVTYGGLTKTITDTSGVAEPNAQQVFFGTFNGVPDGVTTPASGELTIEGDFAGFSCGTFNVSSKGVEICGCITGVIDWGNTKVLVARTFNSCSKLMLDSLPNSITTIGDGAFINCTGLTLTSLPDGVTSIGESVFSGCTGITQMSWPNKLRSIGKSVFSGCTGMTSISLPSELTTIGELAFYNCSALTLTSLPDGVTSIGNAAFRNCYNVDIADIKVANIGEHAFDGTKTASREPLIISEGVTNIGAFAFVYSSASPDEHIPLNITIASTVKTIGRSAFYCGDYSSDIGRIVTMKGTVPPTLETDDTGYYKQFDNPEALTKIVVPTGCSAAYKADPSWIAAGYANKITEG